ncbi:MAG: GNAT family N-acetyltransferase [Firmicutes bacterium]|nr:GNAT family N-acetyltransferase [Bacillota bacterium]
MTVRPMTIADYPALLALWNACLASARDMDDTPEAVARFLRRNPGLSVVALETTPACGHPSQEGNVIGSILCGHDGRRGYLYHVAVDAAHRRGGVARAMAEACLAALRAEGISNCALIAFTSNGAGNAFWEAMGFDRRGEIYYREKAL